MAQTADVTTNPGELLGTVAYMSPEQARGETADGASDIFSLGIILYELATGRHPFQADSQIGYLHAIVSQWAIPPSRVNPEIPANLEALILKMLEKVPRLRPRASDVDSVLSELAMKSCGLEHPKVIVPVKPRTVGREKERSVLRAGLESVTTGTGLLLCVAGEPGIGKTTLVEDFLDEIRAGGQNCSIARGRCSERLAGSEAYLPFLEALESLLHEPSGSLARVMKLMAPTWYAQLVPLSAGDSSDARILADIKAASQERLKRELSIYLQTEAGCWFDRFRTSGRTSPSPCAA